MYLKAISVYICMYMCIRRVRGTPPAFYGDLCKIIIERGEHESEADWSKFCNILDVVDNDEYTQWH